jgi:hypothetical protein
MSLSKADQTRIITEESEKFLDSQFAGLDLSSYPQLQEPPNDTSMTDDRFAKPWGDLGGFDSKGLKRFLADPDAESLERAGEETGNPKLLAEVRGRKAAAIVAEFRRRNPAYLQTNLNRRRLVGVMAYNFLGRDEIECIDDAVDELVAADHWTVANLESAYMALLAEGLLVEPSNQPRQLTDAQRLRCAQLAANGAVLDAMVEYIKHRLSQDACDEVAFMLSEPSEFTIDPAIRPILEEAVWFGFENSRHDYSPTPERRTFLRHYVAGRFLTLELLNAAWKACQEFERDALRSGILGQVQPAGDQAQQVDLDSLSDEEVNNLYHRTLRTIATDFRGSSGVLV